jgi:IS30 family transposase
MHLVHETIYQALYVQGRGELRRELDQSMHTGRALRKPRRQAQRRQPRFRDPMVMINERPAEAEDRAVPGHWEGHLIISPDAVDRS